MDEDRKLVQRSRMLIFLGWELSSSFMVDQIRRQDKSVSFEETNIFGELQGLRFNLDSKTMVVWSMDLDSNKPTLMEVRYSPLGNVIFWNITIISSH